MVWVVGAVVLVLFLMGAWSWEQEFNRCSSRHPGTGLRCRLGPGHFPRLHTDSSGRYRW